MTSPEFEAQYNDGILGDWARNMPEEEKILIVLQEVWEETAGEMVCFLEGQHARPQDAGRPKQTFNFGDHYGGLKMALRASKIYTIVVQSAQWMPALDVGRSADFSEHADWKRHLRDTAIEWHPELKPTLKTADAILLSEYAMSKFNRGELKDAPKPKRRPVRKAKKRNRKSSGSGGR